MIFIPNSKNNISQKPDKKSSSKKSRDKIRPIPTTYFIRTLVFFTDVM